MRNHLRLPPLRDHVRRVLETTFPSHVHHVIVDVKRDDRNRRTHYYCGGMAAVLNDCGSVLSLEDSKL